MRAGQYAYRDRRNKKREFRALWIARINAAARELGLTYSVFMDGLRRRRSTSTARCSPTSPCTTRRRSRRSSRKREPVWVPEHSAAADKGGA